MIKGSPGYTPLLDCCCMSTPPVLHCQPVTMAFNFSAVPGKADSTLCATSPLVKQHDSAVRRVFHIFSRLDLSPVR
jgi:ABC-type proline/glycine betaine transport system permease subunit